jgi:hypothetical protein
MDQALLKELAHFKVMLKKQLGVSADISKLMADREYGLATLTAAEECDDVDLITLALTLKSKLGLLPVAGAAPAPVASKSTSPAAPAAKPNEVAETDKAAANKYVFGTRG